MMRGRAPIRCDVAQGQPDQLAGCVVGWEMVVRLDDLAQSGIDALDRVGGVDHPLDLRREREER